MRSPLSKKEVAIRTTMTSSNRWNETCNFLPHKNPQQLLAHWEISVTQNEFKTKNEKEIINIRITTIPNTPVFVSFRIILYTTSKSTKKKKTAPLNSSLFMKREREREHQTPQLIMIMVYQRITVSYMWISPRKCPYSLDNAMGSDSQFIVYTEMETFPTT